MIYGAAGLTGLTGWRLLQRTASAQTQLLAKDPTIRREQQAFARRMDALRKQHDHEQRQLQAHAAAAAVLRWSAAVPA